MGDTEHDTGAGAVPVRWLSTALGTPVHGPDGHHLGHLRDVRVTEPPGDPVIEAILVDAGGHRVTLPAAAVTDGGRTRLRIDGVPRLAGVATGADEPGCWLGRAVLGTPVLTEVPGARPRRVTDVGLRQRADGRWALWGIDTRPAWQRRLGLRRQICRWDSVVRRRAIPRPRVAPGDPTTRQRPFRGTHHVDLSR